MTIDSLGDGANQRLVAIEAIRQLKARYCRLLDSKRWSEYRELFTADARFQFESPEMRFSSADEFVASTIEDLGRARTVHHVHAPEIEFLSVDHAHGVWAMEDLVEGVGEDALSWHGYGHYHEEYRRVGGGWRIVSVRLTRLRVDVGERGLAGGGSGVDLDH